MTKNRLSELENTSQTGDVKSYSSFVRIVKIILPLIVLGIIGLLVLWPQLSNVEVAPLTKEDMQALQEAKRENRLLQPVYNTLDSKGKPVSITAEEARQNRTESDRVYLIKPTAEMSDTDNTLYLEASEGEYDQTSDVLTLKKDVKISDKYNRVLTTNDLTTSISQGKAQSTTPAKLTSDQGVIEGQAVIIDHQNATTIFQGPAKAVINQ